MVVRARPLVTLFGVVAGLALVAAAVPTADGGRSPSPSSGRCRSRRVAWTALVPLIVSVTAAFPLAVAVVRRRSVPRIRLAS